MIFDRKEKVGPEGRLRDHNGLVELCIGTVSAQNMGATTKAMSTHVNNICSMRK